MNPMNPNIYYDTPRLYIETGISGGEQESNWMNGTLQGNYETTEFTVHTYIDVPPDVLAEGEQETAQFLCRVLRDLDLTGVRFEIRVGRGGGLDDEDEEALSLRRFEEDDDAA